MQENDDKVYQKRAPARTAEARESQLISYAVDLAEKKLMDGTASNQLIIHYLRLATEKERLERENLKQDLRLKESRTKQIDSMTNLEEIFTKGFEAMRSYAMPRYNDID